jgi:hypothetical protein
LGESNFRKYRGKRFAYEWDCCWLGWSLAQLNPTLLEQKGLLQRATDNVASFVFQGCMSRTKLKTHRNENKSRDSQAPLHEWEQFMMPRPEWLPGLDPDKREKERLKRYIEEANAEYDRHIPPGQEDDPKSMDIASHAAIQYYFERVNGETFSQPTVEKEKNLADEVKKMEYSASMNYINIAADPHVDDAQQIRVNVLFDKVRENGISDSVRHEGMVFLDNFDTATVVDTDLKTKIENAKASLELYRANPIGLIRAAEPPPRVPDLVTQCGLDINEYNQHWRTFQSEMNTLGFKVVTPLYSWR